jgi:MFS family permease
LLFVRVEAKAASPLVRPALFRDPVLRTGFLMSAMVTTVVMATLVVGPFYLSGALGLDAARVGLVMSAGPVAAALVGVPAGRAVDRFGANRVTLAGLMAMAAGTVALAMLPALLGLSAYVVPLLVATGGYAAFQAANNTGVLAKVQADQRGLVSGLLNLSRNLGLVTGASVMGAVFVSGSATPDASIMSALALTTGMQRTFAVAATLVFGAIAIALSTWTQEQRANRA